MRRDTSEGDIILEVQEDFEMDLQQELDRKAEIDYTDDSFCFSFSGWTRGR